MKTYILTLQEIKTCINKMIIAGQKSVDLTLRLSGFECLCAEMVTGEKHSMRGFRYFYRLPKELPAEKHAKMKTEVVPIFAEWAEKFVSESPRKPFTNTVIPLTTLREIVETYIQMTEDSSKWDKNEPDGSTQSHSKQE